MNLVTITEIRNQLPELLKKVNQGEEIIIIEGNQEIARIIPTSLVKSPFPSLKNFRSSLTLEGENMSVSIIKNREEERF
jgi:prevent-host-death family protein